jgi:ATP-dependent DNA helicase RecQ
VGMPPSGPTLIDPANSTAAVVSGPGEASTACLTTLSLDQAACLPLKLQWSLLGWYRLSGHLDRAISLLDLIEERGGETARGLEERARIAFAQGSTDDALALLRARADRAPSATATIAIARMHLAAGALLEAKALSVELLRSHPQLMTVASLAAEIAQIEGDMETARSHYEGVLDEHPDNATTILALGRIALDAGDPAEAMRRADQAIAPDEPQLFASHLLTAAGIYERCHAPGKAAECHHRASVIDRERTAALAGAIANELVRTIGGGGPLETAATPSQGQRPERRPDSAIRPPDDETHPAIAAPPEVETPVDDQTRAALRTLFGHPELRPGQAEVIANVRAGKDTLAIMPTGAGKSLTFQLPAMLATGTTLVISPLIALMKDQVESLPATVREQTTLVNSTLSPDEQRRILDRIAEGHYRLVYAAPERLRQHAFLRALRSAGVSLVVIDEAHCISMWGHDFRPDYLTIPVALPELGDPPVLAITATATPRMAGGIGAGLGRDLELVRTSVFRPNLFLAAERMQNREAKVQRVVDICRSTRGTGIVYVSSRKDAEQIAAVLRDRGVGAVPYHAGLDPGLRARNQERFMAGEVRVVVATVAFGMGVDKKDVRFIVHMSPPKSLEAYAQESGRAGRDGELASCTLLVGSTDQSSLLRLARRDEIPIEAIRQVYAGVKRLARGVWATLDPATLLPPEPDPERDAPDPRVALGLLQQADLLRRHADAPASYTVHRNPHAAGRADLGGEETWPRLAAWAGLDHGQRPVIIQTADACAALGIVPADLGRLLASRDDLVVREGPRLVCLEILPAGHDAATRLTDIMARARDEARMRIAQVIRYADGAECHHAMLAHHLGEALDPCRTACDVCRRQREARLPGGRPATAPARSAQAPSPARRLSAEDALAAIEAVRTLPFSMGKTGLIKLLAGSIESRVREDRSAAFGTLSGLTRGKIDGLLDQLVEDGFLHRDLDHEYKLITVTARGARATAEDLAAYASPTRRPARGAAAADLSDEQLGPDDLDLLQRLTDWRRERASRDAVPPYVIAHNSMLQAMVLERPATPSALAAIAAFGPNRAAKYGDEVLAVIAGAP